MVRGKNDPIYIGLWNQLIELSPDIGKPKSFIKPKQTSLDAIFSIPRIYTEGVTDWKHLEAALEKLQGKGLFKSLKLHFEEVGGDDVLINHCRSLKRVKNETPVICIFDRDNPSIIKEVMEQEDYKPWGNNVFSFAIPIPPHRRDAKEICIELYYTDDEIKTLDEDGRRLFLNSEFNSRTSRHKDRNTNLICTDKSKLNKPQTKIIDHEVFNEQNDNVALSKNDFADRILGQAPRFNNFDFTAFERIFKIIEEIVEDPGSRA